MTRTADTVELNRRHDLAEEVWYDEDAGPLLRPYVFTGGRLLSEGGEFSLISLVQATAPAALDLTPEQAQIVELCGAPTSVAEVGAHLNLPVGSVRVLLSDLRDRGLIAVSDGPPGRAEPSVELLEALLSGLSAL